MINSISKKVTLVDLGKNMFVDTLKSNMLKKFYGFYIFFIIQILFSAITLLPSMTSEEGAEESKRIEESVAMLNQAIENDDLEGVKAVIYEDWLKADMQEGSAMCLSIGLRYAVQKGNKPIIQEIADRRLYQAVSRNDLSGVKEANRFGANNDRCIYRSCYTAIQQAFVEGRNLDIIREVVASNPEVWRIYCQAETLLSLAFYHMDDPERDIPAMTKMLLESGVSQLRNSSIVVEGFAPCLALRYNNIRVKCNSPRQRVALVKNIRYGLRLIAKLGGDKKEIESSFKEVVDSSFYSYLADRRLSKHAMVALCDSPVPTMILPIIACFLDAPSSWEKLVRPYSLVNPLQKKQALWLSLRQGHIERIYNSGNAEDGNVVDVARVADSAGDWTSGFFGDQAASHLRLSNTDLGRDLLQRLKKEQEEKEKLASKQAIDERASQIQMRQEQRVQGNGVMYSDRVSPTSVRLLPIQIVESVYPNLADKKFAVDSAILCGQEQIASVLS